MAGSLCDRTERIRTSYFLSDVGVKVKEEITEIIKYALEISYSMRSLFTMSKENHELPKATGSTPFFVSTSHFTFKPKRSDTPLLINHSAS